MIRPLGFASSLLLVAIAPLGAQRADREIASSAGDRASLFTAYDVSGVPFASVPASVGTLHARAVTVPPNNPERPVFNPYAFLPESGVYQFAPRERDERFVSVFDAGDVATAPSPTMPLPVTVASSVYSPPVSTDAAMVTTAAAVPPVVGASVTMAAEAAAANSAPTGLTGLFNRYDFNGLPVSGGTPVSTLYSADGLTFAGAYYGPPDGILYGFFSDGALYNYGTGQVSSPSIQLLFSSASTGVAFNYASVDGPSTLTAWLGAVQVGVVQVPTTTQGNTTQYWGFQFDDGVQFDRLTIAGSPRGFGLDNLQVRYAPPVIDVPEPGTGQLLLLGLAALGMVLHRRLAGASRRGDS